MRRGEVVPLVWRAGRFGPTTPLIVPTAMNGLNRSYVAIESFIVSRSYSDKAEVAGSNPGASIF